MGIFVHNLVLQVMEHQFLLNFCKKFVRMALCLPCITRRKDMMRMAVDVTKN